VSGKKIPCDDPLCICGWFAGSLLLLDRSGRETWLTSPLHRLSPTA